jgi:hypothetical protein
MDTKKSLSPRGGNSSDPFGNLMPALLIHSLAVAALCAAIYAALVGRHVAPLIEGAVLVTLLEVGWVYYGAKRYNGSIS